MKLWIAALILNVVHLTYHQVTTNFDLFPFNNIRHYKPMERLLEAGLNGIIMAFPIVALCLGGRGLVRGACWTLGFLIVGEFLSWWPYYFWGVPKFMRKFQEVYDRSHKHTLIFLPPIRNHPIPNLEHCILHCLTITTFAVTLWYCLAKYG